MTFPPEKPESEWTEYPITLPCGCILNRGGSLFHQCSAANWLLYGSLEAEKNGDMDLCHKLAAEYDAHIDELEQGEKRHEV
jgi:hypothetical protein